MFRTALLGRCESLPSYLVGGDMVGDLFVSRSHVILVRRILFVVLQRFNVKKSGLSRALVLVPQVRASILMKVYLLLSAR